MKLQIKIIISSVAFSKEVSEVLKFKLLDSVLTSMTTFFLLYFIRKYYTFFQRNYKTTSKLTYAYSALSYNLITSNGFAGMFVTGQNGYSRR